MVCFLSSAGACLQWVVHCICIKPVPNTQVQIHYRKMMKGKDLTSPALLNKIRNGLWHTQDDQRAGAPHLKGKAKRIGTAQPGQEKALGQPNCCFPVPEWNIQERIKAYYKNM